MIQPHETPAPAAVPLCVDLDGTLIRSNSLHECALAAIRANPFYIFIIPFWLLKGQARLWKELAARSLPNVALLPYRDEVLAELRAQRARGRKLVLVTGADQRVAEKVAGYLGVFDEVFGSVDEHLVGSNKESALIDYYGVAGFDYIGDSYRDLKVWQSARTRFCAGMTPRLQKRAGKLNFKLEAVSSEARRHFAAVLAAALRVHQWTKNVLVIAPMLLSHKFVHARYWGGAAMCFAAFCCCASLAYLINDLVDLEADRRHPSKRSRPLASGLLSIPAATITAMVLSAAAVYFLAHVNMAARVYLGLYFALTMLYSLWWKRVVLLDVFILASLYSIRVLAGGAATAIVVSAWTIGFFMFSFLSLALMKRYTELMRYGSGAENSGNRRGYHEGDIDIISQAGVASGLTSVLVFALYINSPDVHEVYRRPELLWLLGPVLCFGILSMWLSAHRGEMSDDPIQYAITHRGAYLLAAIAAVILVLATI